MYYFSYVAAATLGQQWNIMIYIRALFKNFFGLILSRKAENMKNKTHMDTCNDNYWAHSPKSFMFSPEVVIS